ncbi:MAG TPA: type II toxin-antitoxin system HipA family toxin [Polyangiaceae bacterium]
MSDKRLVVSLPGRDIGELTQDRHGLIRWTPDPDWDAEQEPRLGVDFLRQRGPRAHASDLPSWFENLLPERESPLRARLSRAHGLRDGQSFELLRALGRDLIGAVEARPSVVPGEHANAPATTDTPAAGEAPGADASEAGLRLSSLTGMQLKFSMSMVNDRLTLSAHAGGSVWIVKLAGGYEDLAEVETATMTWAKRAGFDVPEHFTVPFDHLDGIPPGWAEGAAPAFAVRRFDRREDGSKIHQEDLCQALALRPSNKYGDQGPFVTFEGALRQVHDACGEEDAREMARRMGFVIASGNGDAHLKNWSLLWGERTRPTLTPCYDLVTTIAWESMGWDRQGGPNLALALGGEIRFRRLTQQALEACAVGSGCSWAKDEILAGIERSRNAWPEIEATAPERMRGAVSKHWSAVPLLDQMGPLMPPTSRE